MHYLKCITVNVLFLFALLLSCVNLSAQSKLADSIERKMVWYSLGKPSQTLFVHFDKIVYAQNENVWFTGYLLNRRITDNPEVLSVSLVNDLTRKVLVEQKFLMAGGISFGNIFLADTIPPGPYSFVLYANNLFKGKPADVFVQHIIVAATNTAAFKATINIDTLEGKGSRAAILQVNTKEGRPIPGAIINYTIGNNKARLAKGSAKTSDEGKYRISIPDQIKTDDNILEAQVEYNKDVEKVKFIIPFNDKTISVKFYPEGGYLIRALNCTVGWEVKMTNQTPIATTGILYKDNKPVDTIQTDSYGMGRFNLNPVLGSTYSVKLLTGRFRDSVFKLPKILSAGPAVNIVSALANDTLKLKLNSSQPQKVTLLVHNYRQIFYAVPIDLTSAARAVVVNLKIVPKGLAVVSVLDSAGRPICERLFFAHYDKRSIIDIQTDKLQYNKREKVKLDLKFKTADTGLVSVACVQSNRIPIKNQNDIESYVYLKHDLGSLPLKESYISGSKEDIGYLENLLLIKGWRRYTWQEMMKTRATDTISDGKTLLFSGFVTQADGRLIRKPVRLVVVTDSSTNTITTDEKGYFKLKNNWLLTDQNKKVRFLVMAKNGDRYKVTITDPYMEINQKIAGDLQVTSNSMALKNDTPSYLTGLDHSISLKEVKITSRKSPLIIQTLINPKHGVNACGDYVCRYNILNCVNHVNANDNRAAVIGVTYLTSNGSPIFYKGCTVIADQDASRLMMIKGLNYSKEFYGSDYSVLSPSQPEYYSTIFWKNLVKVSSVNPVQLSFYTSDITGTFKVIVEGITQNDVVHKEMEFRVK